MHQHEQTEITSKYTELIRSQRTILLSTVSPNGEPECSYAPYVRDESGVFYIFVSELSTHTKNMLETDVASVLFIQSEHDAQNLFARERVVFNCHVSEVESEDKRYEVELQLMEQKFGETVSLLRSLSDFHLLALKPESGKFIAGFGQAFSIDVADGKLTAQ